MDISAFLFSQLLPIAPNSSYFLLRLAITPPNSSYLLLIPCTPTDIFRVPPHKNRTLYKVTITLQQMRTPRAQIVLELEREFSDMTPCQRQFAFFLVIVFIGIYNLNEYFR